MPTKHLQILKGFSDSGMLPRECIQSIGSEYIFPDRFSASLTI